MLSFSFQKLGNLPFFILSFVPYCRVVANFIVEYVQFRPYQNRTASLWEKMLLINRFCFSRENIKEARVLDTVVDLMSVTLICNHEVKATKLCHTYSQFPFFLFCNSIFIIRNCFITLTLQNASVFCSDAIKINPPSHRFFLHTFLILVPGSDEASS